MKHGRPTKEKEKIIAERNRLILLGINNGFNQSEVADMFRIPRNTVSLIVKKNAKERTK